MPPPTDVLDATNLTDAIPDLAALDAEAARRNHLEWIRLTWQRGQEEPFVVGRHTEAIAELIDRSLARFRAGESTFLIVAVPFRHGKSDLVSRYLPPRFLAEFPDQRVMLTSYSADLSQDFSRFVRDLVRGDEFRRLHPEVRVNERSSAVDRWDIEGRAGGMYAVGFGGAMTGRGYALGIVDDYHKNRLEAESRTMRDRTWSSFTNDFLTRRAPVSITLICATPWTVDDLIGRTERQMRDDPNFPRFEIVRFPARSEEGYLFTERFSPQWYETQFATLGSYAAAGLLQCNPVAREGNVLRVDQVKVVDPDKVPERLRWVRAWDLASSIKELVKEDPDWTVGTLMAIRWGRVDGERVPRQLWIRDVARFRKEAPARDASIRAIALAERGVRIAAEAAGGYKDTYALLRKTLRGRRVVHKVTPAKDLLVRSAPLEPLFEAGEVYIVRGAWNQAWLDELADFPGGAHDDQAASLLTGYDMLTAEKEIEVL